jgi:hypothetical protein
MSDRIGWLKPDELLRRYLDSEQNIELLTQSCGLPIGCKLVEHSLLVGSRKHRCDVAACDRGLHALLIDGKSGHLLRCQDALDPFAIPARSRRRS